MAQTAYITGQTALTLANLITRAQKQNTQLTLGTPDFLGAAQITLPAYAKAYTGDYYITASQTAAPTIFPTVQSAETNGSFYEIPYPADAMDTGILALEILWGTTNLSLIDQSLILNTQLESSWVTASSNTTQVYWRQVGRKIRLYVPVSYLGTAPKYAVSYTRFPTYPGLVGDLLDVPAEDFLTFYNAWLANVIID